MAESAPSSSFPFSCSSCLMWSDNSTVFDDWGRCVKCSVLTSLEARITELENQLRSLRHQSPTFAQVVAGRTPPAQGFSAVRNTGKRKYKSSRPSPRAEFIDPNRFQILDVWEDGDPSDATVSVASSDSPSQPVRRSSQPAKKQLSPTVRESQWTRQTLVIGSSIVRDVELPLASTRCYPGARLGDIEGNLRLLKKSNNRYRQIVIHAGGNDTRRGQSEVVKLQVEAVCAQAKSMCEKVVFSGPLPDFSNSEMFSRFSAFNRWLSKWCPENDVGFIDNWTAFEGRTGVIRSDGIHPTKAGSALLANNMIASLQ